tara:strand:+ start:1753 stop:3291 length:1539 start_codon:yes stop_codon:yes gene_type:complete
MKRFLLILFLGISAIGLGQVPIIDWEKNYGGSFSDEAFSLQQTQDGGYVFTGPSTSSDIDVSTNQGNHDYWIVKLDSLANIEWSKSYGGSLQDTPYSIKQTIEGGYIIAGVSKSADGDVTGNHGGFDIWIIRLDALGNLMWEKALGGSGSEWAESILETNDNGFIFCGETNSDDGDVTGNHGSSDYWVVKLNSFGNLVWQKCFGGTSSEEAYSIVQTNDGGYAVAGRAYSNNGDVTINLGSYDYWILKLNNLGNIEWEKSLGGTDYDMAYCIEQTIDQGFIISGLTLSLDGDVSQYYGNQDCWVVKLDSLGNLLWEKTIGGSLNELHRSSVSQTTDGEYILCTSSSSDDFDVFDNNGEVDGLIVKLNQFGNIIWKKSFGSTQHDEIRSIVEIANNQYVFAGYSGTNDMDVTQNYGQKDAWIVKLNTPQTVSLENDIVGEEIEVYPNPITNLITIQSESVLDNKFNIYDQQGRAVMKGKITGKSTQVSLSKLYRGTYSIQVDGNYKPAVIIKQ